MHADEQHPNSRSLPPRRHAEAAVLSGPDAKYAEQKLGGGAGSESVRGDDRGEDPGLYSLSGQIPVCGGRSMARGAEFGGCGRDKETAGSCVLLQVPLSYVHRIDGWCALARACILSCIVYLACTRTRMHSAVGRVGNTCVGVRGATCLHVGAQRTDARTCVRARM